MVDISAAEMAGAITAGSGQGAGSGGGSGYGAGDGTGAGGVCDMVQRLQTALRRDPEVRAAVLDAHRNAGRDLRAMRLWNGDWIQGQGQEGKGLAGVRQAIVMEVAFAPEDCRRRPMNGLVVISFSDGAGAARIALGSGAWRWKDLLGAERARRGPRS